MQGRVSFVKYLFLRLIALFGTVLQHTPCAQSVVPPLSAGLRVKGVALLSLRLSWSGPAVVT